MSDYLSSYGVVDARRERWRNRILVSLLVIAVSSISGYFFFRTYFEKQTMNRFLALLKERNYPAAHALFGCTPENPCRDYTYEKFLEDWGPGSLWSDTHYAEVAKVRYCGDTVIFNLLIKGDDVNLVVNKADQQIGFAPWPSCTGTIVEMEVQR
ncbi:MAG: hypothetical protein MUF01_03450 [Bryobacterales bacterium]|jgi:hypothetical protein|nr:hypothetical protein [Bryobacterales bacterium]